MESTRFLSKRTLALTVSLAAAALTALSVIPGSGTATAAPTLAETERIVADLGVKLDAINEQYNDANAILKASRAKQAALEAQLKPHQVKADVYQKRVALIAGAAYRGGRTSMITAMLKGDSPQTVIDQMGALDQVSRDQEGAIDGLKKAKKPLEAAQKKVDAEIKLQATQEKVLRDRKAALNKDLAKWKALNAKLKPRASRSGGANSPPPVYDGPAQGRARAVVQYAHAQIGDPYVFGAAGPNSFDCSGLTLAAWKQVGVNLPHSARQQYAQSAKVSRANAQPGDLVFWYDPISHNGMYIGNNKVIHAPTTGQSVKFASVDTMPNPRFARPS